MRIARIATEAGVSAGLVHYHFASRDALLEEALEHSYERAGDLRLAALEEGRATAAQRLAAMIDQCLPTDRALHDDFVLWVELWLRSARDPALRPVAARLYARLHAWFAQAIADGVASGELRDCDVDADGRPPAGAHRRLRHPRARPAIRACRSSAPAPRSGRRSRGDLGLPRPRALIAASASRSASVSGRGAPSSPAATTVAPALTTSAPPTVSIVSRVRTPGRPQPVERAAHHDLGVAARGHVAEVGRHVGDLEARGPAPGAPRRASSHASRTSPT